VSLEKVNNHVYSMTYKKYIYSAFGMVLNIALPVVALATNNLNDAGDLLDSVGDRAGIDRSVTLSTTVGSAISIVLSFVGLIFLVLMVYAGVLWLTARGEDSQIEKSKKIIASTVIGLILTISAYAITFLITSRFGS